MVTPPYTMQASQRPSPAPGELSQSASSPAQCSPRFGPSFAQYAFGSAQGPPSGIEAGGGGEVDWSFTAGLWGVEPLS